MKEKMKRKTELLIEIICLVIIISLCLLVYIRGKDSSCDNCEVSFKQSRMFGMEVDKRFRVNLLDMYNNLTDGDYCIVEWVDHTGFILKEKI